MASLAQLNANRLNAQRSTGPRTEAGKAASRFNAVKYGIEARSLVLPSEDPAELVVLAAEYHQQFDPVGPLEDYLVETVVRSDWLRRRYSMVESMIVMEAIANTDLSTLQAFTCRAALQIARRLASEERSYYRALKELRRTQAERLSQEAEPGEAVHPPAPAPRPPAPDKIGFVPPIPPPHAASPAYPPDRTPDRGVRSSCDLITALRHE